MEAKALKATPAKIASPEVEPDILFISGSPRSKTCVALIRLLEQGAKKAGAKTQTFLLSKKRINPCIGCGNCEKTGNCAFADKTKNGHFIDDYLELKAVLERVDAVAIVAPVYFAGPPAQLKALYDRMQPYWARRYVLGFPAPKKRPAQLFVVGSGEDCHGFAPLSGSTKSAMAVAGFNLEKVNNFIGFTAPKDMPSLPADAQMLGGGERASVERVGGDRESVEKADGERASVERVRSGSGTMSYADIAKLRRRISEQNDLVQRAQDAGSAFARFVVKKKQESEQTPVPVPTQAGTMPATLSATLPITSPAKSSTASSTASPTAQSVSSSHLDLPTIAKSGMHNEVQQANLAEIDLKYSTLLSKTPHKTPDSAKAETVYGVNATNSDKAKADSDAKKDSTARAGDSES